MFRKFFFSFLVVFLFQTMSGKAQEAQLEQQLGRCYTMWRNAIVTKNYIAWQSVTSARQKLQIRNRIYSERRPYPASIFALPAAPPSLAGLKALRVMQKGATATAVYYGKIDFGVGGQPSDNLLLLEFLAEQGRWKYDRADFISLAALPEVRKQLDAGDLSYVNQADFQPSGQAPQLPIAVGQAKYIAKVYVFCPGREVKVKVNKVSDHRFQNTKAAEIVIGGGLDGLNEVQFSTKALEGSTGKEALTIRVYLMSTVQGVKPLKVYEYQVAQDGAVKPFGSGNFQIDANVQRKLLGAQIGR